MKKEELSLATPPWGRWYVLEDEIDFKVKRVEVEPGRRLSYQKHTKRQEHWEVVRGQGKVTLEGWEYLLERGDCIAIRRGAPHRIENVGEDLLVFIEVQTGEYFGEDDILRLDDDYGRS
jgi:mannose-6-phosphate isomerase